MWAKAGANQPFPSDVVPSLNLLGLCDGGWIFSQDLGFAVAAFLFFGEQYSHSTPRSEGSRRLQAL